MRSSPSRRRPERGRLTGARKLRHRRGPGGRGDPRLRFLDQTAGPTMLMALGALRRKRALPHPIRRIGVMKTAGIGDIILASAVVRDLRTAYPDAEVILFAGSDNAQLAGMVEGVESIELATAKPWETIPVLREHHLDVLVDLGQWTRLEAVYSALSGARWTAGFRTPGQRRHYAYDAAVLHSNEVPELENFRALVAQLGVDARSEPSYEPSGELPRVAPEPYVVFHLWPGGFRSELREWPADRWRELAQLFASRDFSIVLTGGPGDVARTEEFVRSCGEMAPRLVSVAGKYRLPELIDVLAGARCVVSVNTGVMHLAAAVGVPTIALNGPTSARRWGPIGPRVVCVDSELPGCGYLNLGFEYDGNRIDCMRGISVSRVAEAALEQAHA